jgi:hypothetical protein
MSTASFSSSIQVGKDSTPEDLAVHIWLANPKALEKIVELNDVQCEGTGPIAKRFLHERRCLGEAERRKRSASKPGAGCS